MKKTFLVTLCLLLALVFSASAEQAQSYTAGDALEGFEVVSVENIDNLGAEAVRFRHIKSGAQVLFLLNDDPNRGFAIGFHTEPTNDAGMLHILEHASCAASEKYPGRDVFFDMSSQAYITDINAWTSLSSTVYYVTSLSQTQLEAAADFYLDCAFNSALLTEPNYFAREGWHYEMASEEDPLTINGIVYNEMQGAFSSIYRAARYNLRTMLFPDTYQKRDSGGLPSEIPSLGYDELIAFYKECYRPANSITVFYGDVDVQPLLKLMNDGYFADAEVSEPAAISAGQTALAEPVSATFAFPAAAGSEQTGSFIYLGFVLPEEELSSYRDTAVWDVMTSYFSDDSEPLMQALYESGIGSGYGSYYSRIGTQLEILFYADDADPARADEFKQIVLEQLGVMADSGTDTELISSIFKDSELSAKLIRNSSNVSVNLFDNLTYCLETNDWSCFDTARAYSEAQELVTADYAVKLIREQLINNSSCALAVTTPVSGLMEENEAALAQTLAEKKAAMSEEEIAAIVADNAAYADWTNLNTPQETLDKVLVVDPQTVEADWKARAERVYEEDGFTFMVSDDSSDVVAAELLLDISGLSFDDQHRLRMLLTLCGCSTAQHSEAEISIMTNALVSGTSYWITNIENADGTYSPRLGIYFISERETFRQAAELAIEMLTETQIPENADRLIQNIAASMPGYSSVESVYDSFLVDTALASVAPVYSASLNKNGMEYYNALNAALAEYEADADAFLKSVADVRSLALNRTEALVVLSGDEDGECAKTIKEVVEAHIPALESAGQPAAELSKAHSTAYTGNASSDYLAISTNLSAIGEELDGAKLVLCRLMNGEYLLPELRLKQGAYSMYFTVSTRGYITFRLYRAPDFRTALDTIEGMPDFLENMELTQELVDSYKLSLISSLTVSSGELNDAVSNLLNGRNGFTREQRLALIEQIRGVSVQDIEALVPLLRRFVEEAPLAVITTADKAAAYEKGFDEIIQLP